ncbi:pleckstrin homology domain-containing family F member 2 isoform X3 [Hydra vulgaris]|uniref:Pleckstrin homology domain-containing family F member 2 isoform X3 n=1 Tax=Hydra vulgaris TaxID=6087 RepID=A0ABM4BY16_HYDVU
MTSKLALTEENVKRIKNIEDCFGSSGQKLYKSGRALVGEGVLTKICRKKPKPRQFFLFDDILVYGNILLSKKKYNKQHLLPLEEVKIVSLDDDSNFRNGWQIVSPSKSFAVYAASPTEKAEWMAHIKKCIEQLLEKTGKKPSGDEAAVWVPDQIAQFCMLCKKTKFSAIIRKHHCRRCGLVVCNSCSSKKFLIPHISAKPVRVCDQCFTKMSSGQVKPDDPVVNDANNMAHKVETGSSSSITRKESEKLAESGSSADESEEDDTKRDDDDSKKIEDNIKSEEIQPTFYKINNEIVETGNRPLSVNGLMKDSLQSNPLTII